LRSEICQRTARFQRGASCRICSSSRRIITAALEHFSAEVRFSGFAFGDNIGAGVFGGTTPLVATWLLQSIGSLQAPSAYLIGSAAIMLVVCLRLKETFSLAVK
jgi:hypothetical protein